MAWAPAEEGERSRSGPGGGGLAVGHHALGKGCSSKAQGSPFSRRPWLRRHKSETRRAMHVSAPSVRCISLS